MSTNAITKAENQANRVAQKEATETQKIVEQMNKKTAAVYHRMLEIRSRNIRNDLYDNYDMGKEAKAVVEDKEKNVYGAGAVNLLSQALRLTAGYLYKAVRIVNWVDERRLRSQHFALGWSQLVELLRVDKEDERNRIAQECEKNGWTLAALKLYIDNYKGITPASAAPAPRSPLGNLSNAQSQVNVLATTLSEQIVASVFNPLGELPDEKLTPAVVEDLETFKDGLEKVKAEAAAKVKEVETLIKSLKQKLNKASGAGGRSAGDSGTRPKGRTQRPVPSA